MQFVSRAHTAVMMCIRLLGDVNEKTALDLKKKAAMLSRFQRGTPSLFKH